ncbi:MAG: HypC/HybG/HupF family hydrogenase formation chaperone [Chloroflexota bacterium]
MCLGYPALVLEVDDHGATVDDRGRRRRASTLMCPEITVGVWVLVAAGAIAREIDSDDAEAIAAEIARAQVRSAQGIASGKPTHKGDPG